ncbi:50S ribosomal protein L17 [Collinsella sp. zg1085]|uniref:50S ribosomal protein L17 n=1 Tax=Collinsella sp. zg1085 TaxID=2844380 RepID=UPI001C0D6468|nr:50S ribosomal protein L17 [Collinsella sp. zg1085]QWT17887.1 50S ribosomal protein L17 [Collinsella sp. zg1085]
MRHNKKKGLKLGTSAAHTKAIKRGLAKALFENDRIKTTETRAKALRGFAEPIITWAKKGDLHSRRLAIAKLGDKDLVKELFDKAAQGMWQDRQGGYTRIMKLGTRKGDNAEMVIIELVTEPVQKKAKKHVPVAKKAAATLKTTPVEEEAVEAEPAVEEVAEAEVVAEQNAEVEACAVPEATESATE